MENYTAVIILNYNNAASTENCIESVKKFLTTPVKFIVIDNGSNIDEYKKLEQVMKRCFDEYQYIDSNHSPESTTLQNAVLIRSEKNLGYACGNNFGLKYVYEDSEISHILILNNDILFVNDLISDFISASQKLKNYAIITPLLLKRDGKSIDYNCARRQVTFNQVVTNNFLFYWWRLIHKKIQDVFPDRYLAIDIEKSETKEPQKIELPSGSCMFVEKEFFREIGGFDPNTFLYQEENILYEKIKPTGRQNYLLPYAKCIHLGGDTISTVPNQIKIIKIALQSEDYFMMHYMNLNIMQKAVYKISKNFFFLSLYLQKKLFKILGR